MHRSLKWAAFFVLCALTAVAQRRGAPVDVDQFRFRFVGPLAGNRVASVAAVPE